MFVNFKCPPVQLSDLDLLHPDEWDALMLDTTKVNYQHFSIRTAEDRCELGPKICDSLSRWNEVSQLVTQLAFSKAVFASHG